MVVLRRAEPIKPFLLNELALVRVLLFCLFLWKVVRIVTGNQKRFADEYLIDLNATRAYKVAYPSVKTENAAASGASRLLRNVKVQKYIEQAMTKLSDNKIADAEEVLQYLTDVLRGVPQDAFQMCEETGEPIEVKISPSIKDKLKAAELLGKRHSVFTDKIKLDLEPVKIINDLKE